MKLTEIHNDQKTNNNDLILERDSFQQENQLFKNAIDDWSKQYEQLAKYYFLLGFYRLKFIVFFFSRQLTERDEFIEELKQNNGNIRK